MLTQPVDDRPGAQAQRESQRRMLPDRQDGSVRKGTPAVNRQGTTLESGDAELAHELSACKWTPETAEGR